MLYRLVLWYKVRICSLESWHAVVTCLTDSAIQISSVLQGENLLCVVIACGSDLPTNSSTEVSEGKPECYKARQF